RCRNLWNGETCGFEGRRDGLVRVERVMRLPVFALSKRSFGRTVRGFRGCSSNDEGAPVSWNLNGCNQARGTRHIKERFVQPPPTCDVVRRGDSHIQEKCTCSAARLPARCRRERYAMRHATNGKRLNQRITVFVAPYAAHVASDQFLIRRTVRKPVHIGPL